MREKFESFWASLSLLCVQDRPDSLKDLAFSVWQAAYHTGLEDAAAIVAKEPLGATPGSLSVVANFSKRILAILKEAKEHP